MESLLRWLALAIVKAEMIHNPEEAYDDFTIGGGEVGAGDDEYFIVKYFRRKRPSPGRIQELYVATPIPQYDVESV